jgi:hypothetical protein
MTGWHPFSFANRVDAFDLHDRTTNPQLFFCGCDRRDFAKLAEPEPSRQDDIAA